MPMPAPESTCWTVIRAATAGSPADRAGLDALGQACSMLGHADASPGPLHDSALFPAGYLLDGQIGA